MNIKAVFKNAMAYFFSTGLLSGLFVILVPAITKLSHDLVHVDPLYINLFAALVLAALFNPLRKKINGVLGGSCSNTERTVLTCNDDSLYGSKAQTDRLASIGMMAATFAHEIRNPLTSLKTFAQLMPEKYNDADFRNTFSKIVEGEIEKIDGLISDLLDFSTDKQASRINNFDLVGLVDETVDYVKNKFDVERKSISAVKNYGNSRIDMTGDALKLKQAFENIISNGCHAMNGEGVLTVDIRPAGDNVGITVSDTGEGIPGEDIDRIFDPFVTSREMGVGLGLAISKRIIEDHGGGIAVNSKPDEGTTFTVLLPVRN